MNDTELDVRLWEKAAANLEQAWEIILDENEQAAQPTFDERAEDFFPVVERFASEVELAGQEVKSSI